MGEIKRSTFVTPFAEKPILLTVPKAPLPISPCSNNEKKFIFLLRMRRILNCETQYMTEPRDGEVPKQKAESVRQR